MLLLVRIGGKDYIADVGFGALTLTAPLQLAIGIEQSTPHEKFRLVDLGGGDLKLEAWVQAEWKTLYRFDLQPAYAPDYDLANYYVATHPASHFRSTLIAGRPFPGGRYALQNNQLSIHKLGGLSEKRTLTSVAEVRGGVGDPVRPEPAPDRRAGSCAGAGVQLRRLSYNRRPSRGRLSSVGRAVDL